MRKPLASTVVSCLSVFSLFAAAGCTGDGTMADSGGTGSVEGSDEAGDEYTPPAGGMRRLLDYQYVNTIGDMFGPEAAAVASPPDDQPLHGYTAIANSQISPGLDLVEIYEASALRIAAAAIANPHTLAGMVPCVTDSPDQACYASVAQTLGHLAWRRPLSDAEVQAIVEIALEAQTWGAGDFNAGLEYELVRILLSPNFIYVVETGVRDEQEPEEYWLTGPEVVTRLSLLLLGRAPSLTLLSLAEAGDYDSVDSIETLARAMLEDPRAPDAVSEFFAEYLALDDIPAKNSASFPLYSEVLVDSMVEETELLLRDVIWTQDTDFRDFIEADYSFVDARLAELYGLPAPDNDWDRVTLPAEQARAGFLSHASMLARNSHFNGNSTTRRGLYIQQRFLCYAIPPPPPDVNPQLPEPPPDTPMTLRELMESVHLQIPSCAGCHKHMDPLGFTLENFDAIGAWRTQEPNGLPIDPISEYGYYGELTSAADLAASVALDARLGQCIVNNMIRFGRGSLEDPANESAELDELYAAFETSNFRFQALLVAFVTSELFLQVGEPK